MMFYNDDTEFGMPNSSFGNHAMIARFVDKNRRALTAMDHQRDR